MEERSKPYVFTIGNRKGGNLKSTNSVNLAYLFSQEGKKVLLIDCDPQGSTSQILGIDRNIGNIPEVSINSIGQVSKKLKNRDTLEYQLDDLFGNPTEDEVDESKFKGLHDLLNKAYYDIPITKKDVDAAIVTPTYRTEYQTEVSDNETDIKKLKQRKTEIKTFKFGFDLLPSSEELTDDELVISLDTDQAKINKKGVILIKVINSIKYFREYDIIILDTGPSLGILTVNALAAASDGILISASVDEQSLWSLKKFKLNVRQIKSYIPNHRGLLGVILAPCDYRSQLYPIIAYKIQSILHLYLFKAKIPRSTNANKATTAGLLFSQIDSRAYEAYQDLAREILKRREENESWELQREEKVKNEIEKLKEDPEYRNMTERELLQIIRNRFDEGQLWKAPIIKEKIYAED